RIAYDVFLRCLGLRDGSPFDARRKSRTTAAAQARLHNLFDCCLRPKRESSFETPITTVIAIILKRPGIDDTAACEGQSSLAFEPRNFVGRTELQWMCCTRKYRVHDTFSVILRNWSIGNAAGRRLHLHHGLKPIKPA